MLDITFLTDKPAFTGVLVYRYRSGILRAALRRALGDLAQAEGLDFWGCDRDDLLSALTRNLYLPFYWCDWTTASPNTALQADLQTVMSLIRQLETRRFALFVPFQSALLKSALWPAVEERAGLIISEEPVSRETLLPTLRLFQSLSGLSKEIDWCADPAFLSTFRVGRGRKRQTLMELRHAFIERVAACTDPLTQAFKLEFYREFHPDAPRLRCQSTLRCLRTFLNRQGGWDRFDLIRTLDERHLLQGRTAQAIVIELHRATRVLLESCCHREGLAQSKSLEIADVALWSALLLSWDERLRSTVTSDVDGYRSRPNSLIITLDELGRDFLARAKTAGSADRLSQIWGGLDDTLSGLAVFPRDPLGAASGATLSGLGKCLDGVLLFPSWLTRLQLRVRRAISEAKSAETRYECDEMEEQLQGADANA